MIKLIISVLLISLPQIAQAQGFLDKAGISLCMSKGVCTLEDIGLGLVSLIRWMLGTMGVVALIYFIYGAGQWMVSFGRAERVKKGSDIMLNTIFAIIVAFTSYVLLDFFVNDVLNVQDDYRIEGQCDNQPAGAACNTNLGANANYVCDGQNQCITKCELANVKAVEQNIIPFDGSFFTCKTLQDNGMITGEDIYFVKNQCPGEDTNVCILYNADGGPGNPAFPFADYLVPYLGLFQ